MAKTPKTTKAAPKTAKATPKINYDPKYVSSNKETAEFTKRMGTGYGKRVVPTGKRTGGGF
jgi:hypothetical protein